MTTLTTRHRLLAIASGLGFTAGGLLLLLGGSIATPAAWTIHHALTVLTVAGTIAAGHLAGTAWRAGSRLAAAGFVVLFVVGTGLVVVQSLGRQAETSETRTLEAGDHNQRRADKLAELDRARQRLSDAEREIDLETRGRPDARGRPTRKTGCGGDCEDWKLRAGEVKSHIRALEADVERLGAPVPVEPEAAQVAEMANLVGADGDWTRMLFLAFKPLLWTLFFEIGSVVSLGYAFGGGRRSAVGNRQSEPSVGDRMQTDFGGAAPASLFAGEQPEPPAPRPGRRHGIAAGQRVANGPRVPAGSRNASRDAPSKASVVVPFVRPASGQRETVLAAIRDDLAAGRAYPSQRDLCRRFGVPRSTMSDWLGAWEAAGLIPPRRVEGRCKAVGSRAVGQ